jgi:hypothetical protein
MATFSKFQQYIEDLHNGVHNLASDTFTIALTNSAPVATNSVLANITEISYTNASSRDLVKGSSGQTSGNFTHLFNDLTITASGGTVGPFRYVVIYNNTPTSPLDPLVGWFDYGSSITLNDTETLLIDSTTSNITAS